jgi:hypothetical protein
MLAKSTSIHPPYIQYCCYSSVCPGIVAEVAFWPVVHDPHAMLGKKLQKQKKYFTHTDTSPP